MSIVIVKSNRGSVPLNNIWDSEFCDGVKSLDFRRDCYTVFENKDNAEQYKARKLELLEKWISEDIPSQAKNWGDRADDFMLRNKKRYEDIKKAIDRMVIKEI